MPFGIRKIFQTARFAPCQICRILGYYPRLFLAQNHNAMVLWNAPEFAHVPVRRPVLHRGRREFYAAPCGAAEKRSCRGANRGALSDIFFSFCPPALKIRAPCARFFLSPYGLKSRANFKLRTAFGRRRADCPAGEKLSICRFRFPCPPGLFRFCDPDCPSADVFPLIRKVSLWRLRQVKARFAVRRRRTGGALFAPFPIIARFRG